MTKKDQEIVLELMIKADDMLRVASEAQAKLYELMEAKRKLKEEQKAGTLTSSEYTKAMKKNKEETERTSQIIKALGKEIVANDNEMKKTTHTLAQLSREVIELTQKYNDLSEEEKNSAKAQELVSAIEKKKEALRTTTEKVGVLSVELEAYKEKILTATGANNDFVKTLLGMIQSKSGFMDGLKSMGTSVKSFGTALKGLATNPIGAIIMAVVIVVALFNKALSKNEAATKKLNEAMAKLGAVLDAVLNEILAPLVDFILNVIEKAISALSGFLSMLGFDDAAASVDGFSKKLAEASKHSAELAEKEKALAKSQDELTKSQKEHERQAEKLRDIQNDETKSFGERIKAAEDLEKAMQEQFEKQEKVARETLALAKWRMETEGAITENIKAQADAQDKLNEILDTQEKSAKDSQKVIRSIRNQGASQAAEMRQKELDAHRQLEDSVTKLMEDGLDKQRHETQIAYDRQIEDLKKKIKIGNGLTLKAAIDLEGVMDNLKKQRDADLKRLEDENLKKEEQKTKARLEARLSYLEKNSEDALAIRISFLKKEKDEELKTAKELGIEEELIRKKYDDKEKAERDQFNAEKAEREKAAAQKIVEEERVTFEAKVVELVSKGQTENQAKLDLYKENLTNIKQADTESDEDFALRTAELNANIKTQEDAIHEEKMNNIRSQVETYSNMFGAINEMLAEFGANNEALALFSKGLTLYDIGLSTAKALSSGVASAQAVPFPGNLPAIAVTIASIMANIAKAKKALSSEKTPKAPKFASGGLVTGLGSGTSDSINAQLSNGESVITALGTQMFGPMLSAFNQIGGGAPIPLNSGAQQVQGKEMLTEAFKEAMRSMPSPVVSVQEINNTNKRVEVLESYGAL